MAHRGIATLSLGLMTCFLLLTHLDPGFFLLHFYQSLIYLLIVLMLFYFHERWAYMLGILAPAGWLLLTYASGLLGGAMRQVRAVLLAHKPGNEVSLLAAAIALLAALMIVFCGYRWRREYAGARKAWSTFLGSLALVVAYYAVLVGWYLRILAEESRRYGGPA